MGDELAIDRTFLAWLRTTIALVGLGFVVAKFHLVTQPKDDKWLYDAAGVLLVLIGAALQVVGYTQYRSTRKLLSQPQHRSGWALVTTAATLVASLLLAILIAGST